MKNKSYLFEGPINSEIISAKIEEQNKNFQVGGQAIFLGQVRDDIIDNQRVTAIVYSAYEEMVEIVFREIETEMYAKYPQVQHIDILHSTGEVKTGEISFFVLAAAEHRRQAFDAMIETVDLVKEKVPIWKKELFDNKQHRWV